MSFVSNFSRLQMKAQISNYKIAHDLGISQTTIQNWKTGKSKPLPAYIDMIARYFDVPTEELMKGGDE